MTEHFSQCKGVAHLCVFKRFWTTAESMRHTHGTTSYTVNTCYQNQYIVGSGLFIGFVDSKKNIEHLQSYPLNILMVNLWLVHVFCGMRACTCHLYMTLRCTMIT